MTECVQQISLQGHPKKVDVTFDGPACSSDGGLLLLQQVDKELGISEKLAALVPDERDPNKTIHSRLSQVRQRIYQIALGYFDCNDANTLRNDPLLKLVDGRSPQDEQGLSSQPTLSRFENAPGFHDLEKMLLEMEQDYVKSLSEDTTLVVLDIDPTDAPVHGEQEGRHYNGYYKNYIYLPLLLFDGQTAQLISPILRTGNIHASHGAFLSLERVIRAIKSRFPAVIIIVRGDCGLSLPRIHETLDALKEELGDIYYSLGQATNKVLQKKADPFIQQAKEAYEQNKQKVRFFTELDYKADTWACSRKIVLKAEVTANGTNSRYIVHNLEGFSPGLLYDIVYCGHGQCENMIKDLKNALNSGRMSCSDFRANFFRLLLHGNAYRLLYAVRNRLQQEAPQEGNIQFDTLRLKLLKVSVVVRESLRRIWLQLPKSFPLASLFRSLLDRGSLALTVT